MDEAAVNVVESKEKETAPNEKTQVRSSQDQKVNNQATEDQSSNSKEAFRNHDNFNISEEPEDRQLAGGITRKKHEPNAIQTQTEPEQIAEPCKKSEVATCEDINNMSSHVNQEEIMGTNTVEGTDQSLSNKPMEFEVLDGAEEVTNISKIQSGQDLRNTKQTNAKDLDTPKIGESTTKETKAHKRTNKTFSIAHYTYNDELAPMIKLTVVKKMHINYVLRALGIPYDQKYYIHKYEKYCTKLNRSIKPYAQGGPIEQIKLEDDESTCKVLYLEMPYDWGTGHITALLQLKTSFNPTARYVKIVKVNTNLKKHVWNKHLLRFLTHEECFNVYNDLKYVELLGKPICVKLDIGYSIAKKTAILGPLAELDVALNTYQITFYEYSKLKKLLELDPSFKVDEVLSKFYSTAIADCQDNGNAALKPVIDSKNSEKSTVDSQSEKDDSSEGEVPEEDMNNYALFYSDVTGDPPREQSLNGEDENDDGETNVDESDANHCRIVQIFNLPKKAHFTYEIMENLLKEHTSCGNKSLLFKVANYGVGLLQCPTHETAKTVIKELNGFHVRGKELKLKLDIGHTTSLSLLMPHRQFPGVGNSRFSKRKWVHNPADSDDENQPKKGRHASTEQSEVTIPRRLENDNYGLSPQCLAGLAVRPPLSDTIFVHDLDEKVDEAKLHEVFSMAGIIKHLQYNGPPFARAKIVYDHPVEALQAISMFNRQTLFDKSIHVRMDFGKKIPLPLGLQTIGKGFGPNGEPLTGVRNHVELKQLQQPLAELGKLQEVKLSDQPFSVSYVHPKDDPYKRYRKQHQTNIPNPKAQGSTPYDKHTSYDKQTKHTPYDKQTKDTPYDKQTKHTSYDKQTKYTPYDKQTKHTPYHKQTNDTPYDKQSKHTPHVNQTSSMSSNLISISPNDTTNSSNATKLAESNKNESENIDGPAIALKAILAQHGLIKKNDKCHDISSILKAIRNNRNKVNTQSPSSNNDAPNKNTAVTKPHASNNQKLISPANPGILNPQIRPPNVFPIGPPMGMNNPSNFVLNAPAMGMSNPPNFVPNTPNKPLKVPNWGIKSSDIALSSANAPLHTPNIPNASFIGTNVSHMNPAVPTAWQQATNMSYSSVRWDQQSSILPQFPTPVPPVQNFTPAAVYSQHNFNQTTQGNQSYVPSVQEPTMPSFRPKDKYEDRYDALPERKTEKKKGYKNSKSEMLTFRNLPPSVTSEALNCKMQDIGEVIFCEITGKGRAIVRFKHYKDAQRCIRLFHRSKVDKQIIEVSFI